MAGGEAAASGAALSWRCCLASAVPPAAWGAVWLPAFRREWLLNPTTSHTASASKQKEKTKFCPFPSSRRERRVNLACPYTPGRETSNSTFVIYFNEKLVTFFIIALGIKVLMIKDRIKRREYLHCLPAYSKSSSRSVSARETPFGSLQWINFFSGIWWAAVERIYWFLPSLLAAQECAGCFGDPLSFWTHCLCCPKAAFSPPPQLAAQHGAAQTDCIQLDIYLFTFSYNFWF